MTQKIFYEDAYCREFDAAVVSCTEHKDRYEIILDRTAFYPEGGGQPSDSGTVSRGEDLYEVTSAHDDSLEGAVWHYTDAPEGTFAPGDEVTLTIDWDKRFGNMQRHLGEHMLSGTMDSLFGGVNKGFHMGEDYVTIDIDLDGRYDTPIVSAIERDQDSFTRMWRCDKSGKYIEKLTDYDRRTYLSFPSP